MTENSASPDHANPTPHQLGERIIALEILVTHLQQESETLGKILLDQQKQLDSFREHIDKLGVRIEEAFVNPEVRDPAEERPPHY